MAGEPDYPYDVDHPTVQSLAWQQIQDGLSRELLTERLFRDLEMCDDGTFLGERAAVLRFAAWVKDLRDESEREGQ